MSAKPSILIGMGLQKKPDNPLPPARSSSTGSAPPRPMGQQPLDSSKPQGMGGKAARDAAGFMSTNQRCGCCTNYTKETKECSKVEGMMECGDTCREYFEDASGGSSMPGKMPGDGDGDEMISTLGGQ